MRMHIFDAKYILIKNRVFRVFEIDILVYIYK